MGALNEIYGGVFARPSAFNPDAPPRVHRELRCGPREIHHFATEGRRRAEADALQRRHEGTGHPHPRFRHVGVRLHDRHHRYELPGVPLRARLRHVGARLPREPDRCRRRDAVHARRHRALRLSGGRRDGPRGHGRRVRADHGALRRLADDAHVARPRTQGRAFGRGVAAHAASARGAAEQGRGPASVHGQLPQRDRRRHAHHRPRTETRRGPRSSTTPRCGSIPPARSTAAALLPPDDVHVRRGVRSRPAERRDARAPSTRRSASPT